MPGFAPTRGMRTRRGFELTICWFIALLSGGGQTEPDPIYAVRSPIYLRCALDGDRDEVSNV